MPHKDPEARRAYLARTCEHRRVVHHAWAVKHRVERNAYSVEWRGAHREEIRERNRTQYQADPEKARTKSRAKYAANPEKFRAQARAYRAANPEQARTKDRERRVADGDTINAQARARHAANPEPRRAQDRQQRAANPQKFRLQARTRRLNDPEEMRAQKRLSSQKHRGTAVAWELRNREKRNTQQREDYQKNPQKYVSYNRTRRAHKQNAPYNDLTHAQWLEIQEAQQHRCYYCDKRSKGKLTQDHILALSEGGSHTLHNVIGACKSCNSRKGTRPPPIPVQPLLLTVAPAKGLRKAS